MDASFDEVSKLEKRLTKLIVNLDNFYQILLENCDQYVTHSFHQSLFYCVLRNDDKSL